MNLDEGLINPHNQIAKSSLLIIYGSKYDLIHIQGFQTSQWPLDFCPLINNMLRVTVVKTITFWPFMNFSQSHGLQSLMPTSKHFETPLHILLYLWKLEQILQSCSTWRDICKYLSFNIVIFIFLQINILWYFYVIPRAILQQNKNHRIRKISFELGKEIAKDVDIADPSSTQDECHIWTLLWALLTIEPLWAQW